jgi:Zn-dependent metalloprotease
MCHRNPVACIVPPNLLKQIILQANDADRQNALDALTVDSSFRHVRAEFSARNQIAGAVRVESFIGSASSGTPKRLIRDMRGSTSELGPVVRAEGQKPSEDSAINEAYDGFGATYDFYWKVLRRDSIDNAGMTIEGLCHFGRKYNNAFWDGNGHMMFGDGDGKYFLSLTKSLDVIGHELTHGVTQYTANLNYSGQSGALNESISDAIGSMIKQYTLKQSSAQADWLIGAEVVGPALKQALRSMKAPGTANPFDDQPSTMDAYVKTSDDNGGVHTNSGIPNKAFYLAALALGGNSWDKAGPIWYAALRDRQVHPGASFRTFARATIRQAGELYGTSSQEVVAVRQAWQAVKVLS